MNKFFKAIVNGTKKIVGLITNKWLLKATTTVIVVAIVIAGYILLNWGAEQLNIESLDFTKNKIYTLSDETKERLNSLENEITIQLINMKDYSYYDYNTRKQLINGNYIIDYIKKYTTVSDKVKVEEINDLETRVDLQNQYGITTENAIIVIKNGEKEDILAVSDLITFDYAINEYIDRTEEAVTNAIMEVTMTKKPKIYVFNGNTYFDAEQSLYLLATSVMREANDIELLDILTKGTVPEDCDCLIMTTLKQDLTEKERDEILNYINRGGKLLLLTSQGNLTVDTPNFDQVLAQYGISLDFGVVYEQDSSKKLADSSNIIVTEANATFLNDLGMSLRLLLTNPGSIKFAEEKLIELGIEYEIIAETSNSSFVRTDFNQSTTSRTDKDSEEGSNIIGAYVTKKLSEEKKSEIIIYSDEVFASTQSSPILQINTFAFYLYNNEDIILNSVSQLTEREDLIKIRKDDEEKTFSVTDQEDVIVKTIIFVVPVLTIGAGIVVLIVRRKQY